MNITKLGHCCLVIETEGKKVLTDPGAFSTDQEGVKEIDLILITHEHADHVHVGSLKKVLRNNPKAAVITNAGVGKLLDREGISHRLLEGRTESVEYGVHLRAHDCKHAEIFEEVGQVQNTGYMISKKLFYPGDAFPNPEEDVDVLALPVAGPWCKVPDAIRYALAVRPRAVFPVHDGMIERDKIGAFHSIPKKVLEEQGIDFITLKDGESAEF